MTRITKGAALSLAACGPVLLSGVAIHPHAPNAQNMAQVLYIQTEAAEWWPAHALLLTGYVLFAAFLVGASRVTGLPSPLRRVLLVTLPVAWVCVAAMVAHLLLPLGRDSVANSTSGWIMWVKGTAESMDGVWALCVVAIAWSLARASLAGGWLVGSLGMVGGILVAAFSFAIPLTGVLISVDTMKSLIPAFPMSGALLSTAWAVATGVALARTPQGVHAGLRVGSDQV